jgi:anti-sigma regulatory factor (Ser/Thr protein kinase)
VQARAAVVKLSIPAQAAFVQIARLAGSALASRLGFSIDEVDDVRIGIDELVAVAVGGAEETATVDLTFTVSEEGAQLEVRGEVAGAGAPPSSNGTERGAIPELTERILEVVVDEYGLDADGPRMSFWLVKQKRLDED